MHCATARREWSVGLHSGTVWGLYYNQSAKSWQSTTFRPDHKFVVQIRYLETKKETLAEGITETYGYYEIIIDSGKSFALPCWSLGGEHVGKMDRYKQIDCSAGVRDYRLNFEYKRFLGNLRDRLC